MPAPDVGKVQYVIDMRASQFTVQAFASGLISAVAHSPKIAIRDWTGNVEMSSPEFSNAALRVKVKASSLDVLDELPDKDRRVLQRVMNEEVLETQTYPDIEYESKELMAEKLREDLYRVNVKGTLALHGVSNNHSFVAQVAMGPDTARAYGEFTIRQTDYDIRIASVAGGSLKLQDDLKFSFYLIARKVA